MLNAVRFFELADMGVLPVAGGALDQTDSFLDAWRYFRQQELLWECKSKQRR